MSDRTSVITLSCADQPGIVASVTGQLFSIGANIADSQQFWDRSTGRFFMRIEFTSPASDDAITRALSASVERFSMAMRLADMAVRPKLLVMVSKFDHAMMHLLYQIRVGWLNAEVTAVVSNHTDAARTAEIEGLAFHHIPVTRDTKDAAEASLRDVIARSGAETVVLARYMQVLSDGLSRDLAGQVINIHHSFLPSFKGAKPYHQAFDRGVKLIGATAHYVTPDLDEGPIIEQDTARVTHGYSAPDLVAAGRDVESRVLARAVKLHCEHRVMLNETKTVVFG